MEGGHCYPAMVEQVAISHNLVLKKNENLKKKKIHSTMLLRHFQPNIFSDSFKFSVFHVGWEQCDAVYRGPIIKK